MERTRGNLYVARSHGWRRECLRQLPRKKVLRLPDSGDEAAAAMLEELRLLEYLDEALLEIAPENRCCGFLSLWMRRCLRQRLKMCCDASALAVIWGKGRAHSEVASCIWRRASCVMVWAATRDA